MVDPRDAGKSSAHSVLFVLPNLRPGGAEKAIANLANALSVDRMITLASVTSAGSLHEILDPRVRVYCLGGRMRMLFTLPRLVWQLRPAIVFSTIWDLNIVVLLLRWAFPTQTKLIVREAVAPLQDFESKTSFRWFWHASYKIAYPIADAVVVLSQQMKETLCLKTRIRSVNVEVIYNAAPCSVRIPNDARASDAVIRLVALGRLEKQKGYDLLIRALPKVVALFPFIKLTIYGEGAERARLQDIILQLGMQGHIDMPGYTNEPLSILSSADLFVVSSRYEGMSNAMLEALSCGVPVVSTRYNTSAEEVIDMGIDGFLIDNVSPEGIADTLCLAISKLPTIDRKAIRARCLKRFSFEHQIRCYVSLFERAVSRSR